MIVEPSNFVHGCEILPLIATTKTDATVMVKLTAVQKWVAFLCRRCRLSRAVNRHVDSLVQPLPQMYKI